MAGDRDGSVSAAAEVGAALRAARERRGTSVADCAATLRARHEQVVALEAGRLDAFGGEVYARGFLRSYARLLGLDADELLAGLGGGPAAAGVQHLRDLPTERVASGPRIPAWAIVLVLAIVAGAVVAAALRLGGARTPDAAPLPTAPPEAVDAPPTPAPVPRPEPAPTPAAPVAPVVLVLTLEAPSWVEVVADGVAVEPGRTVTAGETLRFEAQQVVIARFGNGGGVRAELNGEDLGPQGRSGQVLRVGYGPEGPLAVLPDPAATG